MSACRASLICPIDPASVCSSVTLLCTKRNCAQATVAQCAAALMDLGLTYQRLGTEKNEDTAPASAEWVILNIRRRGLSVHAMNRCNSMNSLGASIQFLRQFKVSFSFVTETERKKPKTTRHVFIGP